MGWPRTMLVKGAVVWGFDEGYMSEWERYLVEGKEEHERINKDGAPNQVFL